MLFMKSIMYKTKIVVLEIQEIDKDILARCYAPNARCYR
jgi:hypothetical protein